MHASSSFFHPSYLLLPPLSVTTCLEHMNGCPWSGWPDWLFLEPSITILSFSKERLVSKYFGLSLKIGSKIAIKNSFLAANFHDFAPIWLQKNTWFCPFIWKNLATLPMIAYPVCLPRKEKRQDSLVARQSPEIKKFSFFLFHSLPTPATAAPGKGFQALKKCFQLWTICRSSLSSNRLNVGHLPKFCHLLFPSSKPSCMDSSNLGSSVS